MHRASVSPLLIYGFVAALKLIFETGVLIRLYCVYGGMHVLLITQRTYYMLLVYLGLINLLCITLVFID